MAIEIFSETFPGISPRISFSHDLNNQPTDRDHHMKKSDFESDFDFSTGNQNYNRFFVHQELSSADELFSNGRILPGNQIKKKKPTFSRENSFSSEPNNQKKRLKELLSIDFDDDQKPAASPKSFWQFKRSNSLNCESTRNKGLIRSLILFRSNSTGSTPNPKPPIKESTQKHYNLQRQQSKKFPNHRPPLLNKSRSHNNIGGGRFSPILNLPSPYISNATASFFGLGSLFCYNKNKKKKI